MISESAGMACFYNNMAMYEQNQNLKTCEQI